MAEWAVESRYPGELREATQEDAREAIEQAREACKTTLEDLESHGYAPEKEETHRDNVERGEEEG